MELLLGVIILIGRLIYEAYMGYQSDKYAEEMALQRLEAMRKARENK